MENLETGKRTVVRIDQVPPYGNTGAQNTRVESLRACVDWVEATFMKIFSWQDVVRVLGLNEHDFLEMERGLLGYKTQHRYGEIVILSDGKPNMGIHLIMSGQACREYEELIPGKWFDLFKQILLLGKFTRLDYAIDDFAGYFTVRQLSRRIKQGLCRSKFKSTVRIEKIQIDDGKTNGETLYFGSAQSKIRVRFYDKYAERIAAGKDIEDGVEHWVRTEIQARDQRADAMAAFYLAGEKVGDIAAGVLRNYINFLDKGTCSNKARWPVAKFWENFLGEMEKLRLTEVAPDRTIERSRKWIDTQVYKTIGMLFYAYESDLNWLVDVINRGLEDLTEKEFAIIDRYKQQMKNKKPIDQEKINEQPNKG